MRGSSALILSCAALVGVGFANIDIVDPPAQVKPLPRVVVETKVKTKTVYKDRELPSGTMLRAQCHQIPKGTRFGDVIATYGWPREDDPQDYEENLYYPLKHVKDQYCDVMFSDNKVDDTAVTF